MNVPSENPDREKASNIMKYNVVALDAHKPALLVTPLCDVPGRAQMVELTDQEAIMMAANLLSSVNLNRKEE